MVFSLLHAQELLRQFTTVPDQEKSTVIDSLVHYECYEAYKGLKRRDMRFTEPIDEIHKEYIEKDVEKDYLSTSMKRNKIQ